MIDMMILDFAWIFIAWCFGFGIIFEGLIWFLE
jgi:hypothetical protein